MRAGDGFEIGAAPRDDALAYPGALPPFSYLFTGTGYERLDALDESGLERSGVHERLAQLGATPMDQRHAVLAFGSNRSPAQLVSKFARCDVDCVLPVVRARLEGLSVVFAAGIATYGSVPASLVVDPGSTTEVAVTYLDDDQLEVIDGTEGAHHTRPALAAEHGLRLLVGDDVSPCRRYRSARPVLTWDGRPIRLREIGSAGSDLPARSQLEVQRLLLDVWRERIGTFSDEAAFVAAVRADGNVHEGVNAVLRSLEAEPLGSLGSTTVVWPDDR